MRIRKLYTKHTLVVVLVVYKHLLKKTNCAIGRRAAVTATPILAQKGFIGEYTNKKLLDKLFFFCCPRTTTYYTTKARLKYDCLEKPVAWAGVPSLVGSC